MTVLRATQTVTDFDHMILLQSMTFVAMKGSELKLAAKAGWLYNYAWLT